MPAAIPLITIASTVAGVGMGVAGYAQQRKAASDMQSSQNDMVQNMQAAEAQRKQAMELDARRRQMELIRQGNVARATSLASATAGGDAFGSGLQGAYGNIEGGMNTGLTGVSQNLQIGRNIFGINSNITQDRLAYSNAQGSMYAGQGMMSLGGQMVNLGPTIGRVGASFGSMFSNFGGGGYNGGTGSYGYRTSGPNMQGGIWPA